MLQPDPITYINSELPSLWLVVAVGSQTYTFELEYGIARPITVGSASHADIQLPSVDFPPIVCYFEREQDAVLLVPAYRSHALRCDTSVVDRPRRLYRRSVIEIPGVTLSVRVRQEPPTSPNCERVLPAAQGQEGANTEAPRGPGAEGPHCGYSNSIACEIDAHELPTLSRIPSAYALAPHSASEARGALSGAPILDVESEYARRDSCHIEHAVAPPPLRLDAVSELPRSQTLAIADGGAPLAFDAASQRGTLRTHETEAAAGADPLSIAPAVVTIRASAHASRNPLATVGNLASDRPKLVTSCAALGAVALALAMVGASRLYDAATLTAGQANPMSHGALAELRTAPGASPSVARVVEGQVLKPQVQQPNASLTHESTSKAIVADIAVRESHVAQPSASAGAAIVPKHSAAE